jgi:hypothetical protein
VLLTIHIQSDLHRDGVAHLLLLRETASVLRQSFVTDP